MLKYNKWMWQVLPRKIIWLLRHLMRCMIKEQVLKNNKMLRRLSAIRMAVISILPNKSNSIRLWNRLKLIILLQIFLKMVRQSRFWKVVFQNNSQIVYSFTFYLHIKQLFSSPLYHNIKKLIVYHFYYIKIK